MNYIKEINAFYQRLETNPLSSNAANLWHTLMHVNNRAGWRKTFTVAVSVLRGKANLADTTFKRARKELRDKGYIRYESRGGNLAAMYQIVSSEEATMARKSDHRETLNDDHWEECLGQKTGVRAKKAIDLAHKAAPLYKQNETKQRTATAAAEAIHFFTKNIGKISPYIKNDLIKWVNELSEPLVLAAMQRALDRGNGNWGYTKAILENWLDKGFTTVKETEGEVLEFRAKRQEQHGEVIPDWFYEQKQQREQEVETATEAEERIEVERLLTRHASGVKIS